MFSRLVLFLSGHDIGLDCMRHMHYPYAVGVVPVLVVPLPSHPLKDMSNRKRCQRERERESESQRERESDA